MPSTFITLNIIVGIDDHFFFDFAFQVSPSIVLLIQICVQITLSLVTNSITNYYQLLAHP